MPKKQKLVRDKIPEIIKSQGYKVKYHILSDEEYLNSLYDKLKEEAEELFQDRNLEEIADLYEVLSAILDTKSLSWDDVLRCAQEKKDRKGAFKDKIYLDDYEKEV